jgi:exopolysaccharide/PEP-CTERM locus tyrosine autokinase
MSKIAKALEKAKKKRAPDKDQAQRQVPTIAPSSEKKPPVYTQTREISLDTCHLEKHRVLTLVDDPRAVDCYNLVRTQILMRTRDQGLNTIMVTSAIEGEGKTLTAVNLAVSIARDVQQTVLLVDTDLRNPRVHTLLGCRERQGLSDYLIRDIPIRELLINPGTAKMVVLPAGNRISGSTDILGSPKMERLVQELKNRYKDRYVIFDSPPLLTVPDSLVFSSYVDGIVLVVEAGRTSKEQIRNAVELLDGKNILGLIMNKGESAKEYYYGAGLK